MTAVALRNPCGLPAQFQRSECSILNGVFIEFYADSEYEIFEDFAKTLRVYRQPIINSFIMVERIGPDGIYDSRLSNGPIESLNRKVKDLKRLGRGFRNFEHMHNRFLFATRTDPIYNGRP